MSLVSNGKTSMLVSDDDQWRSALFTLHPGITLHTEWNGSRHTTTFSETRKKEFRLITTIFKESTWPNLARLVQTFLQINNDTDALIACYWYTASLKPPNCLIYWSALIQYELVSMTGFRSGLHASCLRQVMRPPQECDHFWKTVRIALSKPESEWMYECHIMASTIIEEHNRRIANDWLLKSVVLLVPNVLVLFQTSAHSRFHARFALDFARKRAVHDHEELSLWVATVEK